MPHYDGKTYQNAVPTTVGPPSGYGALLKRWLVEKAEREPRQPLGPFRAGAASPAAPVPAGACAPPGWATATRCSKPTAAASSPTRCGPSGHRPRRSWG